MLTLPQKWWLPTLGECKWAQAALAERDRYLRRWHEREAVVLNLVPSDSWHEYLATKLRRETRRGSKPVKGKNEQSAKLQNPTMQYKE